MLLFDEGKALVWTFFGHFENSRRLVESSTIYSHIHGCDVLPGALVLQLQPLEVVLDVGKLGLQVTRLEGVPPGQGLDQSEVSILLLSPPITAHLGRAHPPAQLLVLRDQVGSLLAQQRHLHTCIAVTQHS